MIYVPTTGTTTVAGREAASYRDKNGREPEELKLVLCFWATALAIQVQCVKNSRVHFPVCCEIDREVSKQTDSLHQVPSI